MSEKSAGKKLRLTLLSEHSLKPVVSKEFTVPPGWLKWLGPVARMGSMALSGMALPFVGAEAKEFEFASKFMKELGAAGSDDWAGQRFRARGGEPETIGWPRGADLDDLHNLLKEIGLAPHFGGMQFVRIRHKGYLWVSKEEAEAFAEETPTLAYLPGNNLRM